jgi:hypothetical protein
MMAQFPAPSEAERAAPDFRLPDWALRHGLCPSDTGEHDFGGRSFCDRCGETRATLVRLARDNGGVIFEIERP